MPDVVTPGAFERASDRGAKQDPLPRHDAREAPQGILAPQQPPRPAVDKACPDPPGAGLEDEDHVGDFCRHDGDRYGGRPRALAGLGGHSFGPDRLLESLFQLADPFPQLALGRPQAAVLSLQRLDLLADGGFGRRRPGLLSTLRLRSSRGLQLRGQPSRVTEIKE